MKNEINSLVFTYRQNWEMFKILLGINLLMLEIENVEFAERSNKLASGK